MKTYTDKFICLGTSHDYEEYIYWLKSLNPENNPNNDEFSGDVNIIPIAGRDHVFRCRVQNSKPLLMFNNYLLIEHSFVACQSQKKHY